MPISFIATVRHGVAPATCSGLHVEHSRIHWPESGGALHHAHSRGAMTTSSTGTGGRASPGLGFSAYCLQHFLFLEKRQAGISIFHKNTGKRVLARTDTALVKTVPHNYNSFLAIDH
ncbi:MAG: hypothetical protein GYA47_04240 [Desulfovibrio sp.]|nr:hypothetical protein [Desulfovibrio sp.]